MRNMESKNLQTAWGGLSGLQYQLQATWTDAVQRQCKPADVAKVPGFALEMAPHRGVPTKPLRMMIMGIPNVGKSTLINTLKGKKAAKTGDEAGVTKLEQRITLADDFYLYDTPGVLWPRITVEQSGYNAHRWWNPQTGTSGAGAHNPKTAEHNHYQTTQHFGYFFSSMNGLSVSPGRLFHVAFHAIVQDDLPRAFALKEPEPLLTLTQGTSLPTLGSNTRGTCLQK